MGTKTISIGDDAYRHLKRLKKPGESFTQVILRLLGRADLTRHSGAISTALADELHRASAEVRTRLQREHEERRV